MTKEEAEAYVAAGKVCQGDNLSVEGECIRQATGIAVDEPNKWWAGCEECLWVANGSN